MQHSDLYIVDNSDDEKTVRKYLSEWCAVSKQLDVATGYLEVGGLLVLDREWQKIGKIRILLGNEVTKRTYNVLTSVADGILSKFSSSIDKEQEKNEFLDGVPAILSALRSGKIECRVIDARKFHAKAYITYLRDEYRNQFIGAMNVPSGYALVGSSNFTKAGLTQNIELNVQVKDDVSELQQWFEQQWESGVEISQALLSVMETKCKEYLPYDVYVRALYEYFRTKEKSVSAWEKEESSVFRGLSQYQKDGYNNLISIARKYRGAFLCDGVGLGKTYVGMMLIERLVKKDRRNVVLLVPAAARESVWENTIKKVMPEILGGFYSFKIINHTDLCLPKNELLMHQIAEQGEVIIIDEAHHFRNRTSNRYKKLFDIIGRGHEKQLYMLTATPINNSFLDLQHLIELFTQRKEDFFAIPPLGINSLTGHFRKMESRLEDFREEVTQLTLPGLLLGESANGGGDSLVKELVVQRSRAYVKKSLSLTERGKVVFSIRQPPSVVQYSLRKSYGRLIDTFVHSFERRDKKTGKHLPPILALAIYSPYEEEYFIGNRDKIDQMQLGRHSQIVNLIRQLLLKRFESSIEAFKETCGRIYWRLKKFLEDYKSYGNLKLIDRFLENQDEIIGYVQNIICNLGEEDELEEFEADLPDYVWNEDPNCSIDDFDIRAMLDDTILDLEVLSQFFKDSMAITPETDDKLNALKNLLQTNEILAGKKVLIFSEFTATAKYIYTQLRSAGYNNVFEIDGNYGGDRYSVIQRFAPYYNGASSSVVSDEISILVSTDVLSEGLNLQDASCLINYDIHWNPVRLMQRIGRIDRRRDISIEERLLSDHPDLKKDRANAYYWNFLPPEELERLLSLYGTVSRKTLRISKAFGVEGKKLLTPDDDYEALKEFNTQYEGVPSAEEEMALAYQDLMIENPDYEHRVQTLPSMMFSGKNGDAMKGVFFCYALPIRTRDGNWSNESGVCRWYFVDSNGAISDEIYGIWSAIKSEKETPRSLTIQGLKFKDVRKKIETHLRKTYLRMVQAPMGVNPRLVNWMQIG